MSTNTLYLGYHVSSAGGYMAMGKRAAALGANTFAFFTRNPRGGAAAKVEEADVAAFRSCSACFLSVARSRERFLRTWHTLMMRLPKGDAGVVDNSLVAYHQLDESCLNAVLAFLPGAPKVTETYGLDRDPERTYLHFIGRPKPWEGWTPRSARHIETVVSTVEWAVAEGLELPSGVPPPLRRNRLALHRATARWNELWFKARKRLCVGRRRA